MMWFVLLILGGLIFLGAAVLLVLGIRTLSARKAGDTTAKPSGEQGQRMSGEGVGLLVVAAVFLLQACFILVAFIISRGFFGANPWG